MSVMMGALIFGIGMQLGGGCASGTRYTCCAGKARFLLRFTGCGCSRWLITWLWCKFGLWL
ncbi:YeeE/YedE thiosulfate transporter family protein [Acinetobacter towneri]|uniref:YeeE/YedE thiosulfate transporter family protein n=1 Tax=Acinetobacter towneri TaxID=202956 RepID=UPI00398C7E52